MTGNMAKESIPGQMAQNLKATLRMTRRKASERSLFPVETNLRCVPTGSLLWLIAWF